MTRDPLRRDAESTSESTSGAADPAGTTPPVIPGQRPAPAHEATKLTRARRKGRRVVRLGVEGDPVVPGGSPDDSDVGWHEGSGTGDNNDDRLRRDVPPHW